MPHVTHRDLTRDIFFQKNKKNKKKSHKNHKLTRDTLTNDVN